MDILEELTATLASKSDDFNLYRESLDLLPIGVAVISSRIVTWANKKTVGLFGYDTLSEVVGRNSSEFYISREEFERCGRECYPNGGSTFARMRKKDGREIWILIRVQISNAINGRALVLFCSLESIRKLCSKFGGGCT